jgi:hypothetical protein
MNSRRLIGRVKTRQHIVSQRSGSWNGLRGMRTATNCSGLGMSALGPTTGVKTGKAQNQQMFSALRHSSAARCAGCGRPPNPLAASLAATRRPEYGRSPHPRQTSAAHPRTRSGCCARAASGHAAALPMSVKNSRPLQLRDHSITSSARASKLSGTVRPSALAVLRLIASSYLVGACTGRSAGLSPLRMRST